MDFKQFVDVLKDGGWFILVAYFLYKEVWPLIALKIIPQKMKQEQQDREQRVRDLEHEREVKELHQKELDAERKEEAEFRRRIELDRLESARETKEAIKSIAASMSVMSIANAQTNERVTAILANQSIIMSQNQAVFGVLTDAVGDIREQLALRAGYEKRVGETGPLKAPGKSE